MSEGIRSGVNWIRENFQAKRRGESLDHQSLGQTGDADQERVRAGQPRQISSKSIFLVLTDDDLMEAPRGWPVTRA